MLISVIIATKNSESNLAITLDSLSKQLFKKFEIICIDSISTDNTLNIYKNYDLPYSKIVSELDNGIAEAWNKGISFSSGQWIIFLNSGDLLHPNHFHEFFKSLSKTENVDIYYSDVYKFNNKMNLKNKILGETPKLSRMKRGSVGFAHPGSLISSKIFNVIGSFDSSIKVAIDTDLIIRAFNAGCSFKKFSGTAYMEEGGLSDKSFSLGIKEYYNTLIKYKMISPIMGLVSAKLFPKLRSLYHFFLYFIPIFRSTKHLVIFTLNSIGSLFVLNILRILYFKLLGFKFKEGVNFGYGFKFYSVGNLMLGRNVIINRDCLFDNRALISIGDNVSISRNVSFFTGGHDIDSPFFEMTKKPIHVGNNVVIFSGVSIMPGVNIGDFAVVYPGSIVVNDVPSNMIVGGGPAKEIRLRNSTNNYQLSYQYPMAM